MIRSSKNQEFRKLAKFKLNHETLRVLGAQELPLVAGGSISASGGSNEHTGGGGTADLGCCPI
jgi:hypothetical protein